MLFIEFFSTCSADFLNQVELFKQSYIRLFLEVDISISFNGNVLIFFT